MAQIIQEFNTLGGHTLAEHQKNFSLYFNKLSTLSETERLEILDNLKAAHRQEELYLTKLLLKFERTDKIKSLILEGDRDLNKIIVTYQPFVFRNENVNYFMHELFPNASYVVRNKCLNQLAKIITKDDMGEEFFQKVLEKYGIRTAQGLLQVCSESFIKGILTKYRIILRDRQLIALYNRFGKDFLIFYYAECSKYGLKDQFAKQRLLSKYLSLKDIDTFCELLKYGTLRINKKRFKKFLEVKKKEFLKDPIKYMNLYKAEYAYKLLSTEEYREYFLNKLPKDLNEFDVNIIEDDIKLHKLKLRGSFLESIFMEKYGSDVYSKFSNKADEIHTKLKTLLHAEDVLKFNMEEEEMLEYLHPAKSFPLFKSYVNLTADITKRIEVVLKMFKSAKNYNDEESLAEALKYSNHRHKNEQSLIRHEIFTFLKSNYKIEKLSATIWVHLHELILTEQMVNEKYPHWIQEMYEEEVHYKFVNGLDCSTEFKKYVKQMGYYYFFLPSKNKDLRKWALQKLPEVCKEIFPDEHALTFWPKSFLFAVYTWNQDNPKDTVSYFEYGEVIDMVLNNEDAFHTFDNAITSGVYMFKTEKPEEIQVQNKLIEKLIDKLRMDHKSWRWFLRHRIDVFTKHVDSFFRSDRCLAKRYRKLLHEVNLMHYTPLPEKIRAKVMDILQKSLEAVKKNENCEYNKYQQSLAVVALSFNKDFLEIIKDDVLYPSDDAEINVLDESFKETLRLQEYVADCLRNWSRPKEIMPIVLRFCYKDYFKFARPAVFTMMYHMPEKDLPESLKILLGSKSMTIRKCALCFATILGSAEIGYDSLKYAGEEEKSASLQKFIFSRTFSNFCNIGNRSSWELLLEHFKFVFEKDPETHALVFRFDMIPRNYLALYVETVWHFVGKQWKNQHGRVMKAISPEAISILPDELCDDIVQHNLVHSKEQFDSSDVEFIYFYLLSNVEKITHRLSLIATTARLIAGENTKLKFKEFNERSHKISFLYNDICKRLLLNDERLKQLGEKKLLVLKLAEACPTLPLPYNHFEYQLQLDVCRCFLDDPDKLPELFIKLQKDVLGKYGDLMVECFDEFICHQMSLISNDVEYRLNFIEKMLALDNSANVKLMAILLLPACYPSWEIYATKFRDLLEKIEADSAPIVSIYLNRFLKKLCI